METLLLLYSDHDAMREKSEILKRALKKKVASFGVRFGKTARSSTGWPRGAPLGVRRGGFGVISIYVCRIYETRRHIAEVERRLNTILTECEALRLLDDDVTYHRRVDITASNGTDDSEWLRPVYFGSGFLRGLNQRGIGLRINVFPPAARVS